MNALGAQELLLPSLHPRESWEHTGRWETVDDLYKLTDTSGRDYALGPTHEEVVTPLAKRDVASYRDLPFALYQFQTKFRMEPRAKSGLLRGREFPMKDCYSFHRDEADLDAYYERATEAYRRIFERLGLGDATVLTYAAGGTFSKYSHEFQTITPAGEDTVYHCERCRVAVNAEIIEENPSCPTCGAARSVLREVRAIEVGNIFKLKTKFSEPFGLTYRDEAGADQPVLMGCYGIGLGRVMGAIVEVHHDGRGLAWPAAVAPYQVHLVRLGEEPAVVAAADELYRALAASGAAVLYDDRAASAGVKLNDADLIGVPLRVVASQKTAAAKRFEYTRRAGGEVRYASGVAELKLLL
jgi:prolyl-tRNA synthetase